MAADAQQLPAARVRLAVESSEALRVRLYPDGLLGGLVLDGPPPAALGDRCEVQVQVMGAGGHPLHFTVQGVVAWARRQGSRELPPSYGVAFAPGRGTGRERLVAFAEQTLPAGAARSQPRLVTEQLATVRYGGVTRAEMLSDVSEGGAFVRTRHLLAPGAWVQLSFRPPGSLRQLRLAGRVAWVRDDEDEQAGFGVTFQTSGPAQAERLRRTLRSLRARAAAGG